MRRPTIFRPFYEIEVFGMNRKVGINPATTKIEDGYDYLPVFVSLWGWTLILTIQDNIIVPTI